MNTQDHRPPRKTRYDSDRSLISYVVENASDRPDAPAILTRAGMLTYADMMQRADRIATRLWAQGVTAGDFVGIWSTRSVDALISMLGILRVGAAFVPLDRSYASDVQLRQMVGQVPFAAILSNGDLSTEEATLLPAGVSCLSIATVLAENTPEQQIEFPQTDGPDPVCMVFTSGTTGRPKGVVLPNRGLASFGLDQDEIGIFATDRVLHASSLACDGGLIEVWLAFLNGAALAIVETAKPELDQVADTITTHGVTVTSQYVGRQNLLIDYHADAFTHVRLTMAGGDVQSPDHIRRLKTACPDLRYVNIYGLSETTCISLVQEVTDNMLTGGPVPIGRPMAHEHAFVVDENLEHLADGEWGQLVIGGEGVALGYYGLSERTAETFIEDPRPKHSGTVYLTGDLAMRRPDGVFEFGGRADRQIKLGGRRMELDGIEHVMRSCAGVKNAVVEVFEAAEGDFRIGAVIQPEHGLPVDETAFKAALCAEARKQLHQEMLPKAVLLRADIPVTTMGKPDRRACRAELVLAPLEVHSPQLVAGDTQTSVRDVIAGVWQDMLRCGPISDDTTFFTAGGTSLRLFDAHARIKAALDLDFELTLLFEKPQLGALAEELAARGAVAETPKVQEVAAPTEDFADDAIAIIGLAARVPGAPDLDAFWDAICEGRNLIQRFDPEDLEDAVSSETRADPNYVPARSVLDGVEDFDAKFFNILPSEAERMDPQARVFLEICVQALEHAGLNAAGRTQNIGVYAGSSVSTYMLHNVLGDRAQTEDFTSGFQIGNYSTMTGNIVDTLATRVAYKLNLKGPALSVNTACSTSLTAIAQAVTALRAGQCEVALAGGVSITFPQKRGYMTQEGGMSSPDGLCRPFDAQAQGTVFGHGAGVLVLKPLAQAQQDGDRIEAVIRGIGLNNDGSDKISFTAPSVTGQADAIRTAHADAGISPETVSYLECHGTATPLGDPIEIRALNQAFGPDGHCALGSVKGNIGHLDAGAGVVSIIKTVRMMREQVIPPVAHYQTPNPGIDFEAGPFFVPTGRQDWTAEGPRRAGVSGFGIGGTNVHIVLEEAPTLDHALTGQGPQVLPISAKSPEALTEMAAELAEALSDQHLPDVAHTLQSGRAEHAFRMAVAAETIEDAVSRLRLQPAQKHAARDKPEVVFMFPGQGGQYPGMGSGLYCDEPVYAEWIDKGLALLDVDLSEELRPLLTEDTATDDMRARLTQTRLAQPALFLTQFAGAQLWRHRGVEPAKLVGHSIGEIAVAAFAGVLSFEHAVALAAMRGALMQQMQSGAMLSVRATRDAVEPFLKDNVELAACNAPKLQVLAGPHDAIEAVAQRLSAKGLTARKLHTSHAFHSRMMAPAAAELESFLQSIPFSAPNLDIISTYAGPNSEDMISPAYWSAQMCAPVRFADAMSNLGTQAPLLLEVGAGNMLCTFAAQTLPRDAYAGLAQSLPDHARTMTDSVTMATALGQLWCAGVAVDWTVTNPGGNKLALPGTHFIRKRHWIEAPTPVVTQVAPSVPPQIPQISAPQTSTIRTVTDMSEQHSSHSRQDLLTEDLARMFADLSGEELTAADADASFLELGFDSLFMGQAAQALLNKYGVSLSFRALLSDYPSLSALAAHLDDVLPADPEPVATPKSAPAPLAAPVAATTAEPPTAEVMAPVVAADGNMIASVLQAQMQTMQAVFSEQLRAVGGTQVSAPAPGPAPAAAPIAEQMSKPVATQKPEAEKALASEDKQQPFKFGRAPVLAQSNLTDRQLHFVQDLVQRYSERFAGSKAHTQDNRQHHADPRSVAGYRDEWKDLTFPIVAEKSKGAYIEDVDRNRFVDLVNGFGQTAFGHSPDFVADAVRAQLDRGYAIGPQADLAGPVAAKFARLVGHERVTFCNTGSEAVMAAMRVARTVTGRQTVVVFNNDYHGQFDEVLVKGKSRGTPGALPIAPGIPRDAVANMVVLEYGADASLDWVRDNIDDIAAVIVEPVQSRHPDIRPVEFVRTMRDIAGQGGAAFVMDEVVTGFRTHMRGMQGVWDIQPDLATYGKVVGGGMPVGVLAGTARFMDALDGGDWRFGDDSSPQTAPTFFAGTFVRHPLVVAAMDAVLDHLEAEGEALWTGAADMAAALAGRMNAALNARGLPNLVTNYSSWFVINVSQHDPRATLLHALMRLQGVHTLDGFCGFLTTEHTQADCDFIFTAFESALDELQSVGILAPQEGVLVGKPACQSVPSGPIPLTESQREIWMTNQLGDVPAASFNESVSLTIDGPLDQAALTASIEHLVERHDALRLKFAPDGSTFEVQPPQNVDLTVHDLTDGDDAEAALAEILQKDANTPVSLGAGLPLRCQLIRMQAEKHVLVVTTHHIVCDGWSYNILAEELGQIYTAKSAGQEVNIAPAPSFAALAARHAPKMPEETRAYWRGVFADVPALPVIPTDRPRKPRKSYVGGTTSVEFSAELLKSVRKSGAKHGCTLFATLFAALQITIGRLSGSQDVVLGVPTGGQANLEVPETVGHLVHFLPIRAGFDGTDTAGAHLSRVAAAIGEAFEHGETTLGTLVRELEIDRTIARLPLTEIQFNLERLPDAIPMGAARATLRANPKAAVNFDLFFNMVETGSGLRAEVDFNSDLFDESTVQRWLSHLQTVLEAVASNTDIEIAALPLLSDPDQRALAKAYNPAPTAYPSNKGLHQLVEQTVQRTPDAPAVTDAAGTATYAELWQASGALAGHLQATVPAGSRIGVAMPRDRSMVVSLLAVLRAGMTYVPLDQAQPLARQRNVLQVAGARAVISPVSTHSDLMAGLDIAAIDPADLDDSVKLEPHACDTASAAYVIFTSGSTGAPKGVAVPHRAVSNFLTSMADKPGFTAEDKILSVTTVSFDIAVLELFLPLVVGGQVEIASRDQVVNAFGLVDRLAKADVTVMQATPTLWGMLQEAGFKPRAGLKMLAGGEPLPRDLATYLSDGGELWNMYGPTETTIWSSVSHVQNGAPVTIGDPIANTQMYVLDDRDALCAPGVVGELNIGGDGLAIGYHERPDLTAAAFRTVRIAGEIQRLYRTGDLAVRNADGSLTLLGRRDGQVKLRGFRIELGEIEARLRADAAVAKAAVALKTAPSGTDCLVAYVVAAPDETMDEGRLSAQLAAELPDYMVPSAFVALSDLPQTANGKLDRKVLPDLENSAPVRLLRNLEPAAGETERRIAAIWQEVLGVQEVSVTETIFSLGADSLTIFRIAARQIEAGLGLEARHILEHGTIRALAAQVQAGSVSKTRKPLLSDFRRSTGTGT